MKLKIYGCRGSVPTSRDPASLYGGNTSCMTVELGGRTIVLDAGSGLVQLEVEMKYKRQVFTQPVDILISHLHLDHIIGLTVFGAVWNPNIGANIYTFDRGGGTLKEQIFGAFVPPYFPSSMVHAAQANCIAVENEVPFNIGDVVVTPFVATHPDDTYSFHLTDGEKTVVHLLDSEIAMLDEERYATLVSYCKDADIVVFDAGYSPVDYIRKMGWGHSTIEEGFKLAEDSQCRYMMFSHFGFEYDDEELGGLEVLAGSFGEKFIFAKDGMEMDL